MVAGGWWEMCMHVSPLAMHTLSISPVEGLPLHLKGQSYPYCVQIPPYHPPFIWCAKVALIWINRSFSRERGRHTCNSGSKSRV